jgi:hypothetical protein
MASSMTQCWAGKKKVVALIGVGRGLAEGEKRPGR